jgi:hypothetical protein
VSGRVGLPRSELWARMIAVLMAGHNVLRDELAAGLSGSWLWLLSLGDELESPLVASQQSEDGGAEEEDEHEIPHRPPHVPPQ